MNNLSKRYHVEWWSRAILENENIVATEQELLERITGLIGRGIRYKDIHVYEYTKRFVVQIDTSLKCVDPKEEQ